MSLEIVYLSWGCIPELESTCQDMTNASSTYLGIAIGAIIGAVISWLIYTRQKLTSNMQDHTLNQIKSINDHQDKILKRLEESEKRRDRMLETILELNKRIDTILERQEGLIESSKKWFKE